MKETVLVKLGFAVLIAAGSLFGIGSAPARASDCPLGYGSCVMVDETCDDGQCCCNYINVDDPELTCRMWCS